MYFAFIIVLFYMQPPKVMMLHLVSFFPDSFWKSMQFFFINLSGKTKLLWGCCDRTLLSERTRPLTRDALRFPQLRPLSSEGECDIRTRRKWQRDRAETIGWTEIVFVVRMQPRTQTVVKRNRWKKHTIKNDEWTDVNRFFFLAVSGKSLKVTGRLVDAVATRSCVHHRLCVVLSL